MANLDRYNREDISQVEFGCDYCELTTIEKEWVRDEVKLLKLDRRNSH